MLVSSFGTSTPFAFWGFAVIDRIMEVLFGSHLRIHCLTVQELGEGWQRRDGKPVSVTSDRPAPELARLLLESGSPCLAFVDEPEDSITTVIRHRNVSPADAIRFTTQYFCLLDEILRTPKVNVFRGSTFHRQVAEVITEIVQIIDPNADATTVETVLHRTIPNYQRGQSLTVGEAMARQTSEAWAPGRGIKEQSPYDQQIITGVSDSYRPIFQQKGLSQLTLPKQLFYRSSATQVPDGHVELLGAGRFIIWGPCLFLPVGCWSADIQFEVAENKSGNEIEADVAIGPNVVATGRFTLPILGVFRFVLDFEVGDINFPVEVRFRTMKGAIEGRIALRSVVIARRNDGTETNPAARRTAQGALPFEGAHKSRHDGRETCSNLID
jgi:hypothetical protein